jgi:hypothetical protein
VACYDGWAVHVATDSYAGGLANAGREMSVDPTRDVAPKTGRWRAAWGDVVQGTVIRACFAAAQFCGALLSAVLWGGPGPGLSSSQSLLVGLMLVGSLVFLALAVGHVLRHEVDAGFSGALGLAAGGLPTSYLWFAEGIEGADPNWHLLLLAAAAFVLGVGAVAFLLAKTDYRSRALKGLLTIGAVVGAVSALAALVAP